MSSRRSLSLFVIAIALQTSTPVLAENAPGDNAQAGEKVNVDSIREKYWARGNESELGVVQNRLYSKERKFEFGTFVGLLSSDPFLSVRSTGLSLGYHFSEYLSVHAFGWKAQWSPSTALQTFQEIMGATTNFNAPLAFYGAEGSASLLYGKLSLVGQAIIYYDMHVSAGAGITSTESGSNFTPHFGLGQQIYLSQVASLRLDYRVMHYRERIIEKVVDALRGTERGTRTNWTHSISLGITFLIGSGVQQ